MYKAKVKNLNIDEIIHFDAKKGITINVKKARAIYNSNDDSYENISQIHDVDVETVNKIKQGKILFEEIKAMNKKGEKNGKVILYKWKTRI